MPSGSHSSGNHSGSSGGSHSSGGHSGSYSSRSSSSYSSSSYSSSSYSSSSSYDYSSSGSDVELSPNGINIVLIFFGLLVGIPMIYAGSVCTDGLRIGLICMGLVFMLPPIIVMVVRCVLNTRKNRLDKYEQSQEKRKTNITNDTNEKDESTQKAKKQLTSRRCEFCGAELFSNNICKQCGATQGKTNNEKK